MSVALGSLPTSHPPCGCLVFDVKHRANDSDHYRMSIQQSELCQPGPGSCSSAAVLSLLVESLPNTPRSDGSWLQLLTWSIGPHPTPSIVRSHVPDRSRRPPLLGNAARFYGPFKMRSAGWHHL
jgi:hypothetical protein